jgi:hypothetical protein
LRVRAVAMMVRRDRAIAADGAVDAMRRFVVRIPKP